MLVIGVTGYAQHGKDTLAQRLVERWGFERYAFADALKSMALALNPLVFTDQQRPNRLRQVVEAYGWDAAKGDHEVRRFLQLLGTEGVRKHIGEDAWVYALAGRIARDNPDRVVITDVRFANEASWVKHRGGIVVRVERFNADGTPFDNGVGVEHASERGIADLPTDVVLHNPGTAAFDSVVDSSLGPWVEDEPITTTYEAALGDVERAIAYRYRRLDKVPASEHLR